MKHDDLPPFTPVPFAAEGLRNTIPPAALKTRPGAASMTEGFPPATFQPIAAGGIPPAGADFNGILHTLSQQARWAQAGGSYPYDAAFAEAIGGYPRGALVQRTDGPGQWLNTVEANRSDPGAVTASGWIAVRPNAGVATLTVSPGEQRLGPDAIAAQVLIVTGALQDTATLLFPPMAGGLWIVANRTSGTGSVHVQGGDGDIVAVPQGASLTVYTDGAGFFSVHAFAAEAYLPLDGVAAAAVRLADARTITLDGTVTGEAAFDGSSDVTLPTRIPEGALNYGHVKGLEAALQERVGRGEYRSERQATGWRRDPDGFIEQWGAFIPGESWVEGFGPIITFPIAFPFVCANVQLTDWNDGGAHRNGGAADWIIMDDHVQLIGMNPAGFATFINCPGPSSANYWRGMAWRAFGW